MKETNILRVKKVVPHEDGKHIKLQEVFVEVPKVLYDNALQEKKQTKLLTNYQWLFQKGYLKEHYALIEYIQRIVGRIDGADIERINIIT